MAQPQKLALLGTQYRLSDSYSHIRKLTRRGFSFVLPILAPSFVLVQRAQSLRCKSPNGVMSQMCQKYITL